MAERRKRRSSSRRKRARGAGYEFHGTPKPARQNGTGRRRAAVKARWRRRFKVARHRIAVVAAVSVVALVLFAGAGVAILASTLPDTSALYVSNRQPSISVYDRNGQKIGVRGLSQNEDVPLGELPAHLQLAVLAVEDRRFYDHWGIDLIGVGRALWTNYQADRIIQGGSTITQQLAKNLFLTPDRELKRKAQEALLAIWLEYKFTKDDILELYLNRVYFGAGTFGVEAASRRYFGKSARDVTLVEAAMLAGLVKAPSRFAPTASVERASERTAVVLQEMVDAGFLTPEEKTAAYGKPAQIVRASATPGSDYVLDFVVSELPGFVGSLSENVIVETSLDLDLQKLAEAVIAETLAKDGEKLRVGEGALVALTPAGGIRAMAGGRSYTDNSFNRAVNARRQPGSAFKPFVYIAAIEEGWSEYDIVEDAPIKIGDWEPTNYTNRYLGAVTLNSALARSINTVAIRLSDEVGRRNVIEVARRLGVSSPLENIRSLALGTQEMSLLELTNAYAPLANGGEATIPHIIIRVRTESGKMLYERSGSGAERVLSKVTVGTVNRMLSGVVIRGTGSKARLSGIDAAGKTGTTQDYRDAWFIGYTADFVTGVWFGNDDFTSMKEVTGGTLPAEAWRRFMTAAQHGRARLSLPHIAEGVMTPTDVLTGATVMGPMPYVVEPLALPGVVVDPGTEGRTEEDVSAQGGPLEDENDEEDNPPPRSEGQIIEDAVGEILERVEDILVGSGGG